MPCVSMMLDNNSGEWEPYYWGGRWNIAKEQHNQTIVGPHGLRLSSAGWHADLKDPDCRYWLVFQPGAINWTNCGLSFATHRYAGMVAMPYELNGVDIEGGAPANGGAWDASGRQIEFDYSDWDWINDRGDIFFDDSALSFPIPPHCDTPADWTDTPPTNYYVGNYAYHSMPAGDNWICIQDNLSDSANEPGTPGGAAYWILALNVCWDGADDGDVTGFVWSQPQPYTIAVKPVYADY